MYNIDTFYIDIPDNSTKLNSLFERMFNCSIKPTQNSKKENYSKYCFKDNVDIDRIIKENKDSSGFIVIGKENAIKGIKNYKHLTVSETIVEKDKFVYKDIEPYIPMFITTIISKDSIDDAIKEIKELKSNKSKKEVLVFD